MKRHEWAIRMFRSIRHNARKDYLDEEARILAPLREAHRVKMDAANARLHQILSEPDREVEDRPC